MNEVEDVLVATEDLKDKIREADKKAFDFVEQIKNQQVWRSYYHAKRRLAKQMPELNQRIPARRTMNTDGSKRNREDQN